jgi:hypothetical protein
MNLNSLLRTKFEADFSDSLAIPASDIPHRWYDRLAGLISDLLSPPVVAVAGLGLVTRLFEHPVDYVWVVYYLCLVVGFPVLFLIWKARRGEITDFHIRVREQRLRPMLLTLACAIAAWASL